VGNWPGALAGWTVLVPRGGAWGERAARLLGNVGATALIAPLIVAAPPLDGNAMTEAARRIAAGEYDWVVVTSASGIDALAATGASVPPHTGVAVVGAATARAAEAAGLPVPFQPKETFSAEELVEHFPATPPARVLVLQSDLAGPYVTDALVARGFDVDAVVAYRTVPVAVDRAIVERVRSGGVDAILVTSGSVAREIVRQFGPLPRSMVLAAIGPRTAVEAGDLGLRIGLTAARQDIERLISDLAAHAGRAVPSTRSNQP
jgi:uroporphyrinogen-III synthase